MTRELPVLRTNRLQIEIPTIADATRAAEYYARNREHFKPWEPTFGPEIEHADSWMRTLPVYYDEFQGGFALRFVLRKLEDLDGPIIGFVHFHQMVGGALMSAWLGYNLDHEEQRKGYMMEALIPSVAYCFRVLNVHRINASYMPANLRSARILRNLGFTVEGYCRDFLYVDGAWRDHSIAGLVNPNHAAQGMV